MGSYCNSMFYFFFFFFLVIQLVSSASISFDTLNRHGNSGRDLRQVEKICPINFEKLDYSGLTRKCRGPLYPAKQCCGAFLEFACPYADELNDVSNDCAETMFSYIDYHGKYPIGLFWNICRDQGDINGLSCEDA